MHLLIVGIEQKTSFIDSTPSRESKFDYPKYIPNCKDVSIIYVPLVIFSFATSYMLMNTYYPYHKWKIGWNLLLMVYSFSKMSFLHGKITIGLRNPLFRGFRWHGCLQLAHKHGGKQSITYHLYIFGTINSNFLLHTNNNNQSTLQYGHEQSAPECSRGLGPSARPSK